MAATPTSPAGTGTAAMRTAVAVVRAVVAPRTWLALIHLLAGFVTGLAAFIVVVTGLALGFSLLVLLIGLPLLAATIWCCYLFAAAERARFRLFLGRAIPAPGRAFTDGIGWWRRGWEYLVAPATWKHTGYALVRLPVSAVQATIVTLVWALALGLLALPAYNGALPRGGADVSGHILHGPAVAAGCALGVALLLAAPWVTLGLAEADAQLASWLLGGRGRAELTARIGELERSRASVVDAAEAERRRIERDLHDGAQQRLVALAMELGRAKAKFGSDPAGAEAIVGQAHEQAKAALAELRSLVRGMHPPVLSDRGLDAALSGLAAISPVPVEISVALEERPPPQIEAIAYFVVAEALTNVVKHARASHASVRVDRAGDMVRVVVSDNGIGGADPQGQGLAGLASRVSAVDGQLTIASPAGGPTTIGVLLPCGW